MQGCVISCGTVVFFQKSRNLSRSFLTNDNFYCEPLKECPQEKLRNKEKKEIFKLRSFAHEVKTTCRDRSYQTRFFYLNKKPLPQIKPLPRLQMKVPNTKKLERRDYVALQRTHDFYHSKSHYETIEEMFQ